ncbi:MAG: PilZ domain-containing protein [Pseudomonadota bacterium]|nr:PilZ domain-containing protein [Pseudomonadota bacterium]
MVRVVVRFDVEVLKYWEVGGMAAVTKEFSWYVYQSGQQMGPFSDAQVQQLLNVKMISQDASIFKEGWEDWRAIGEVFGDTSDDNDKTMAVSAPPASVQESSDALGMPQLGEEKMSRKSRIGIQGKVIAHNNGKVIISGGINISASGIFVETTEENSFQVGELIKLTVKADHLGYPFNVTAQMMRFNSDPRYPNGYGMKFVDLPDNVRSDVERLVASGEQSA